RNAADKFQLERKREQLLRELQSLNRELERRGAGRARGLGEGNPPLGQKGPERGGLAPTPPPPRPLHPPALRAPIPHRANRHARYSGPLALGYVDVDHFKRVNTEYLLTGGDQVLRALARVLASSVREVDSVGRVGGEEFLVIARDTDAAGVSTLAERIRSTVE